MLIHLRYARSLVFFVLMDRQRTYIVLLRGVMPSGKNRIPKMSLLREVLEEGGFEEVRTYIQSGNIVLRSALSPEETGEKVSSLIRENIGADLSVVVKTAEEIRQVLEGNPFVAEKYDMARLFFTLFNDTLDRAKAQELADQDFGEEEFAYTDHAMYMYLPRDASRSKLSNNFLERKLKITTTTRNLNTLKRLLKMADPNPCPTDGDSQ